MSWGKVCDTLHAHRKLAKAGALAMGYWVAAMSWCKDKRTNGFVPADRPAQLYDEPEEAEQAVAALVRARLWEVVDGGWRFHDWNDIQRSPEEDADARTKRSEWGRKGGMARAAKAKASHAKSSQPKAGQVQPSIAKADQADSSQAKAPQGSATLSESTPNPFPPVAPQGACGAIRADPSEATVAGVDDPLAQNGPQQPDVLRKAILLAEDGVGVAKSVCDRAASGRRPTPDQAAAVRKIWDKRYGPPDPAGDDVPEAASETPAAIRVARPSTTLRVTAQSA